MVSSQRTPPPHSNQSSHFWRNICKLWDSARCQIKWYPGNGENIRFWSDFWVGDHGPFHLVSTLKSPSMKRLGQFLIFSMSMAGNGTSSPTFFPLTFCLPSTPTQQSNTEPTCHWSLVHSGNFLTSSPYKSIKLVDWGYHRSIVGETVEITNGPAR